MDVGRGGIAVALVHLAFWDVRALVLIKRWKESGVTPSPGDDRVANDALLPLCQEISPRIAATLAV